MGSFDPVVHVIRRRLPDVVAIDRYGSVVTEYERRDSDVDLAVLPARPLTFDISLKLAGDVGDMVRRPVDLVDWLKAPTILLVQIIAYGERLYCADERACAVFEDDVFSSYAKFNEERRELVADILARGSVYGG
ncbi:MAG: type VII toxin-antitoxin system MntA family adenylyltransferase antitoxin [Nitrospirota bacterium]